MKVAMFAVPVALALSACGGSETTNPLASTPTGVSAVGLPATNFTKSELAAMSPTSTMPTGNAAYAGKFTATGVTASSGSTYDTRYESDFGATAFFDAKTIQTHLTNTTITFSDKSNGSIGVLKTSGTASGSGTINGSAIDLGAINGTLATTSFTVNGVPQSRIKGLYSVSGLKDMNFVGDNAAGIYQSGTSNIDGSLLSTEIYANRK